MSYVLKKNIINYRKRFSFLIEGLELSMLLVQIYYWTSDNIFGYCGRPDHLLNIFFFRFISFDTYNTKLPQKQHRFNCLVLFSQLPSIYYFSLNIIEYTILRCNNLNDAKWILPGMLTIKSCKYPTKISFWSNVLDNGWRCFCRMNI